MTLFAPLLDLLFPRRCALCGGGRAILCGACRAACLAPAPGGIPRCARCDHPRRGAAACPDCMAEPPAFEQARALGPYQGRLRAAVIALKYRDGRALADPLAEMLHRRALEAWPGLPFDGIVGMPLDAARERARGYNQAALLASRLAVRCGLPHLRRRLIRRPTGRRQSDLSREERRLHLADAFAATAEVSGRRLLLVDDVMTTGATLNAAARALQAEGATVWALVLARGTLRAASQSQRVDDPVQDGFSNQRAENPPGRRAA